MLQQAIQQAKRSNYIFRIGAIITKKGRIVGKGYNRLRYHSFRSYYRYNNAFHAETAAILNSKGGGDTITVVRISKTGKLGMAKPCPCCTRLIRDCGIRWVVFSTSQGILQKVRVNDLLHEQAMSSETDCLSDGEDLPAL